MVRHLWWSLLGIAEMETLDSVDTPTVVLVRVLYGAYLIVAAILLINLMIALLSNTYQRVEVSIGLTFVVVRIVREKFLFKAFSPTTPSIYDRGQFLLAVRLKSQPVS